MSFRRVVAAVLPALALAVALSSAPASAQRSPDAAPTVGNTQQQDLGAPPAAAPTTNVEVTQTGGTLGPVTASLSPITLFERADLLVKVVLLLLLAASLWSWTIIVNKWLVLGTLRRRAAKFEKTFWSGLSLDELYTQFAQRTDHPMAAVFVAALREWRRAFEGGNPRENQVSGVKDRIDKAMSVTILRETDGIERQLGFLARSAPRHPSSACSARCGAS